MMTGKYASCDVIYLHGFGSSPAAPKPEFFQAQLEKLGVSVAIPDLNGDSFEKMTLTSQMQILEENVAQTKPGRKIILIGAGMGGLLAVYEQQKNSAVAGLILLSPGFSLLRRWHAVLGHEELEQWRKKGSMEVYNYAQDRDMPLSYEFYTDAQKYQTEDLTVSCPTLVFHGKHSALVEPDVSKKFAKKNPQNVELHMLDDDELMSSLDFVWEKTLEFVDKVLKVKTG
jgi:alpha-beta hydrolase superfamily lysophospholipase